MSGAGAQVPAPKTALVLGGGSDIAQATVRRLAPGGLQAVVLAVRDAAAAQARLDTERRGPAHGAGGSPAGAAAAITGTLGVDRVFVEAWDANDVEAHRPLLERARAELGTIDLVLCAVGSLGHHSGATMAVDDADALLRANFVGPATALLEVSRHLVAQGHGTIVVLSSVAGARARRSNFVYGSAKAGIDTFAQGLGDAVVGTGVRVHIVRPGFVRTKMTEGLVPAPFASDPDDVAAAIATVIGSSRNRIVWVPKLLGPVLGAARLLPASLWRRVAGDR